MSKENKIIKYGLQEEVNTLLDQGFSYGEVVESVKAKHPDIIDLQDLSKMCIMRFKEIQEKELLEKNMKESDGDYVNTFLKDFRVAMSDLNTKS